MVAWDDLTSGNWEIYIMRWNGSNWIEVGTGSAVGGGISNNAGDSHDPYVVLDSSNNPVMTWMDNTSGNYEIYIMRWSGSAWEEIGVGSATGGGISNNAGFSIGPYVALDSSDNPIVVWWDDSSGNFQIYVKKWDGFNWVEVGIGSASGGGISNSVDSAYWPSLAIDLSDNPVVAWSDNGSGNLEIYIKRWDGLAWVEVGTGSETGGGISNTTSDSFGPYIVLDSSDYPVVVWTDNLGEIYLKRWSGSAWEELFGSATGGGISNNSGNSQVPSLALDSFDNPVVAWLDNNSGNEEIYIKRWSGSTWQEIDSGSASGGGISNNTGRSSRPSLSLDSSDYPFVTWWDDSSGDREIYIKRWVP